MMDRSSQRGRRVVGAIVAAIATTAFGCSGTSDSQSPSPTASSRVSTTRIDDASRVRLAGNVHPLARPHFDAGLLSDDYVVEQVELVLKRSPELEAKLAVHMDALHDKTSPLYQRWLTAVQFGETYGASLADIETVTTWLESFGMRVDAVPPGRMFISFSATVAQLRSAFGVEMHAIAFNGARHIANWNDPTIPTALAGVVHGIHALHDFMPHPMHKDKGFAKRDDSTGTWSLTSPDFTVTLSGNTFFAVAPPDFATIYNLNPLFNASSPITGAGQTIAVIENTNIQNAGDVSTFRSAFGLSAYKGTFSQTHPSGVLGCTNPGVTNAEGEAALDAEWAGAAAPDASIVLASCKDNGTLFGGLIAVQNLLAGPTPPPIISISYGECELGLGASGAQTYVNAYQQAVTMGISVFVASGDQGAAVCDAGLAEQVTTQGIAVNGFASTPYNVAVGGTDFMDFYDSKQPGGAPQSTYWNATNTAVFGSAKSYIPEIPWNASCASKLIDTLLGFAQPYGSTGACNTAPGTNFLDFAAGSGGPSTFSNQPSWQTGVVGLPTLSGSSAPRYVPDVSLFAGNGVFGHFYVYCMSDAAQGGVACTYPTNTGSLAAGGTSFAAPALAGIQALINQKMGGVSQGNPNYTYYKLAAAQAGARGSVRCNSAGGTPAAPILPAPECIFNDVTQGDMDVPCKAATPNCFAPSGTNGVLSTSSSSYAPAFTAGTGWDYATGLGTVNAYNLVTAWSK
jgi:subtilase family serine protease